MAGRREKLDIIRDILEAIRDKGGTIKPTHLLYKSNLSHDSMKRYVSDLMEREMVETSREELLVKLIRGLEDIKNGNFRDWDEVKNR